MLTSVVAGIDGLMQLIDQLDDSGYEVWLPTVRDGILVTRRFQKGDELPVGSVSEQSPGAYGLVPSSDRSRFGWAVGPQPWKPLLHPASVTTMTMSQSDRRSSVAVSVESRPRKPLALFGMRPCDLAGVDKLDRVLLRAPATGEPTYSARRADAFLVVVNCGVPASTCFCSSLDTGPHVDGRSDSHDIEITELVHDTPTGDPDYLIAAMSERGVDALDAVASRVSTRCVASTDVDRKRSQRDRAVNDMGRHLPNEHVAAALAASLGSRRWDEVAETCLACGNCTAVCPTCFCTTVDDVGDLAGTHVERRREWESCFSLEFSRLGNSPVRASLLARYRQWMTHKLGTWHEQFGESGCVGCGRCTTWCPAGIDFVAVARGFVDEAGIG